MNLFELHDVLPHDELTICESIMDADPELKGLIAQQLTKPIMTARKQALSSFVPKLKAWAKTALATTSKTDSNYNFIVKVLNNPETVANQLVNSLSSRGNNTPVDNEKMSARNNWVRPANRNR